MAEDRDVSSLPLAEATIKILQAKGFHYVKDIHDSRPLDLSKELGVSAQLALSIVQSAQASNVSVSSHSSAKDLLEKRGVGRPIISFCRSMDQMMGGGIPIGQITEIVGGPGLGKTQLAIQLALNVQIPEPFKGNGAEAIYIDTEGSFSVERAAEMASYLSEHLVKISRSQRTQPSLRQGVDLAALAAEVTMEKLLEGINVYRPHDHTELLAIVNQLPAFLRTKTNIRLIVIDSIAFPFRQNQHDIPERNRILSGLAQSLNQIAFDSNIAVVLTNHVTTRFDRAHSSSSGSSSSSSGGGSATRGRGTSSLSTTTSIVPALGELWSHCVTHRVMLQLDPQGRREAVILKSPGWPPGQCLFRVCELGVRDFRFEPQRDSISAVGTTATAGGIGAAIPVERMQQKPTNVAGAGQGQQQQQQQQPPAVSTTTEPTVGQHPSKRIRGDSDRGTELADLSSALLQTPAPAPAMTPTIAHLSNVTAPSASVTPSVYPGRKSAEYRT